jgi:transposase-like protein
MQKEARFRELIDEQKESGLTILDFCSNHGLAPSTFHYWKKKFEKKSGRKDFIPLILKPSRIDLPKGSGCSEISPGKEALLELVYPNGTILRLKHDLDLSRLRALIHLYD